MKLSDYVWGRVADEGVRHVFMFPGGGAMHLVDSLGSSERLRYVTLLHEQACSFAAETYARIDDNIGVVCVTTGPGGTNAITGCAAAWLESTPVVFISGQVKTMDLKEGSGCRQKGNQEIGIIDLVTSITKYAVTVKDPQSIVYHLDKAFDLARSGRPGPVWIDIPLDVQAAQVDPFLSSGYVQQEGFAFPSVEQLKRIEEILKKAKRPVIIAGQGVERGKQGRQAFRSFIETLGAPVLTTWIGTELLPHDHYLNYGKPGIVAARYSNFILQNADLVISIGARLDSSVIGYNVEEFAPHARKVVVDVDCCELEKFTFFIDEKVCTDAVQFITKMRDTLNNSIEDFSFDPWRSLCKEWRLSYSLATEKKKEDASSKKTIDPIQFTSILSDKLEKNDVIIPGSSGAGIDAFWLGFKNKEEQRLLATGSLGSMGYGLPAAIGACLASGKRTICIEGDGSIQLNIQELASVIGLQLPMKIFIFDNSGYLSIMNMQRNHFNRHFVASNNDSSLFLPNILAVAKAYGFTVFDSDNFDSIEKMIDEVLDTTEPTLCRVSISSEYDIRPKVKSVVQPDGSIKSGSLENLWPFMPDEELETIRAVSHKGELK